MADTAITLWHDREPLLLSGLCQYCTVTFAFGYTTWLSYEVPWNRSVRYPELTELLDSGCPACEMLSHGIRWHLTPHKDRIDPLPDMGSCKGEILVESMIIQTESRWDLRLPANENGPYQCDLVISCMVSSRIRGRVPGASCLSPSNKVAMKAYLEDCSNHHVTCQSKSDRELPSRLLDVDTGCKGVRLVDTGDLPAGTAYATLSHVWGNPRTTAPFLVTTQETVDLGNMFIPFEALPQTFQDAVEVTRALDLRYVWIDSLCIIQDSSDDWHKEAPRMAKIYSNAYATIVATRASSAHDGFLKRPAPAVPPARIPYCIPTESSMEAGHFYLQTKNSPSLYHEPTMDLEEAQWNSRGWTFQERILSRRLVHFTKDLIFIECWSGDWAEDNRVSGGFYSRMPWLGGKNRYSEDPKAMLSSWYAIVESYSCRFLTKEEDKLHALAGVMERVQEITGFTNIAGLWREDFANGLSWVAQSGGLRGRRLTNPQGPSWSWASWEGPIAFSLRPDSPHAKTGRVCFEVLHIEPVQSPFIPNSGHLKVKGLLLPVSKDMLLTDKALVINLDLENDGSGYLDANTIHEALGDDLMAFPLMHYVVEWAGTYECLLLRPAGMHFRRVGVLKSSARGKWSKDADAIVTDHGSYLGGRLAFPPSSNTTEFTIV
ncbi:HET-domain-containing protein [Apiospora aurea]|uniref:HET-domain-containing protein n=1 Tax=Apiospora aurea TaxID=335848 RepID=A0ABR1PZC2_9PEZI